jgi:hypothetical protein
MADQTRRTEKGMFLMAMWDSDETSRRKAFEILDEHNIVFDASIGAYRVYNDGKVFDKEICAAFDAMRDEGLVEIDYKDKYAVGVTYRVDITVAGIAYKYADR